MHSTSTNLLTAEATSGSAHQLARRYATINAKLHQSAIVDHASNPTLSALVNAATPVLRINGLKNETWRRRMGQDREDFRLGPWRAAEWAILDEPTYRARGEALYFLTDDDRDIIVFHLLPIGLIQDSSGGTLPSAPEPKSIEASRKLAIAACNVAEGPAGRTAVNAVFARSKAVRDYVLMRASGTCEGCFTDAPFLGGDGLPYLEAHHTTRLSDGGIDHPRHVAALCPTCHRRIHYGQDGPERNKLLIDRLALIEPMS